MAREQMLRAQAEHWDMYEASVDRDVVRASAAATRHRTGNLDAWRTIIDAATGEEPGADAAIAIPRKPTKRREPPNG
jgi:hypothetical protein